MEPLCTEELKGNADVVEFCNIPPYLNLLVAASYTLQEGPVPIRVGGLHVFSVEKTDKNHAAVLLQELQVIETSGVFDIKWRGSSSDLGLLPCLGQASADGSLRLYSLQEGLPPPPPSPLILFLGICFSTPLSTAMLLLGTSCLLVA